MYEIKKVTADDVTKHKKELFNIFIQIKDHGEKNKEYYTNRINQLKTFLNDDSAVLFCAFDNEKLIGFNWFYVRNFDGEKRVSMHYMGIDKDYRKNGIGSRFIEANKNYAIEYNIKKIELYVDPNNKNAISVYKKNNFKEEKILMLKEI